MGVCTYCQWMSAMWILKANAVPAARRVTSFLCLPPFLLRWLSTQSRNFVSLIPFFGAEWHSRVSGRQWCPCPTRARRRRWIPLAKDLTWQQRLVSLPLPRSAPVRVPGGGSQCSRGAVPCRWTMVVSSTSVSGAWVLLLVLHNFSEGGGG